PAPSEPPAASVEAVERPMEALDETAGGALADSEAPAKETEQAPEEERAPRRRKRSGTHSRSRKSAKTAREETPEISPLPETAAAEPEPAAVEEVAAPPDSTEVQAPKRAPSRRSSRWWHGTRRKSKKAESKGVPAERPASDPEPST
ncbi:MAG: hypothetical protein IJS21_04960, partial [Deltaproteobacteria bacterium]|nr:hypothetical protein [Deltaproteobacteria bacterium]